MNFTHLRSFRYAAPVTTHWPATARRRGHDLLVDGNSMLELADALGTPCTRTSAAAPGSAEPFASVIVTRVLAVDELPDGTLGAWVDAALDACRPWTSAALLLGRRSRAGSRKVRLRPGVTDGPVATLPSDIRAGDLIALPCAGGTALADVRGRGYRRPTPSSSVVSPDDSPDDSDQPPLRCGR